ncbi:MAG TPA: 30S ribosomal protein S16 [Dehalococcoidia bacterium]|nr:30S ribosomal protein S16 [Dehalococcoidia bacterium]
MLRIRLTRVGKKKQPSYRVVVAESRAPRDGAFVEIIGHYNPLTDPPQVTVQGERAQHWLQKGARPSEAAAKILTRAGVMERPGAVIAAQPPAEAAEPEVAKETKAKPAARKAATEKAAPKKTTRTRSQASAQSSEGEAVEGTAPPEETDADQTE